jgi:glycosyltransferase involved in cell wall biosynthesis
VISVSHFTKRKLADEFRVSSTMIPNGFKRANNPSSKQTLEEKHGLSFQKRTILTVSSEESRKNVDVLLKSVAKIPDVQLVKVGSPVIQANREKNNKIIDVLDLHNKVTFLENISESDLSGLYRAADLFALISDFEGFGRPPIEAQLNGCPVLVSEIPAFRETLGESCGYVQDYEDPDGVAASIQTLLEDKDRREELVKEGYENSQRFHIDNIASKFRTVLTTMNDDH